MLPMIILRDCPETMREEPGIDGSRDRVAAILGIYRSKREDALAFKAVIAIDANHRAVVRINCELSGRFI